MEIMIRLNTFLIRGADIAIASAGLLLSLAPMIVIGILIRMDDGGPALFIQKRVGRDRRLFNILKFRTMTVQQVPEAESPGTGGADPVLERRRFRTTQPNDARITRIGRILRSTHLDELPQLLNVIAGDMSMVGARPDTPIQEVDYPAEYWRRRHALRPGITGPAQLHSATVNLAQRTELELTWLRDPGILSYFRILVATVFKVAKRSGI